MGAEHLFCYFGPAQGIRKSQEVLGPFTGAMRLAVLDMNLDLLQ